jgi:hypothetical protein
VEPNTLTGMGNAETSALFAGAYRTNAKNAAEFG